jgi:hypothetical protein
VRCRPTSDHDSFPNFIPFMASKIQHISACDVRQSMISESIRCEFSLKAVSYDRFGVIVSLICVVFLFDLGLFFRLLVKSLLFHCVNPHLYYKTIFNLNEKLNVLAPQQNKRIAAICAQVYFCKPNCHSHLLLVIFTLFLQKWKYKGTIFHSLTSEIPFVRNESVPVKSFRARNTLSPSFVALSLSFHESSFLW